MQRTHPLACGAKSSFRQHTNCSSKAPSVCLHRKMAQVAARAGAVAHRPCSTMRSDLQEEDPASLHLGVRRNWGLRAPAACSTSTDKCSGSKLLTPLPVQHRNGRSVRSSGQTEKLEQKKKDQASVEENSHTAALTHSLTETQPAQHNSLSRQVSLVRRVCLYFTNCASSCPPRVENRLLVDASGWLW